MTVPQQMADQAASPGRLALSALSGLEAVEVSYCVWKGSTHLVRSLDGDGDLDMLVDEAHLAAAKRVLKEHGFVHADRVDPADQPGLEDWFGLDGPALVHVQLYWRLYIGDLWSGWWHISREGEVLRERRPSAGHRVYVSSPAHEAALLFARAALATRPRDAFIRPLWRRSLHQWDAQWRELVEAATRPQVRTVIHAWFGEDVATAADADGLQLSSLVDCRTELLRRLEREEGSSWRRVARFLPLTARRLDRRAMRLPIRGKRGVPGAGLVIAIVGAEASAVADQVARFFAPKFDTYRVRVRASSGDRIERRTASARRRGLLVVVSGGQPPSADRIIELDRDAGEDRDSQVAVVREIVWSEMGRRGR